MSTDGAPCSRTDHPVVPRDVAGDTAHCGTLQTTFSGRHRRQSKHLCHSGNKDECVARNRAYKTDGALTLWRRRASCNASGTRRSVVSFLQHPTLWPGPYGAHASACGIAMPQ